jgi:hypothetical protein
MRREGMCQSVKRDIVEVVMVDETWEMKTLT